MMDEERDLITFEDDNGKEWTLEVVDYLYYEGKEYVILTDYDEDEEAGQPSGYVMEVVPVEGEEDEEEFIPIDDDLAIKVFEVYQTNEMFDENDEYDDEEE